MFEDKEEKAREEIIDYALKLSRAGLNVNSSGNLSVRFDSPEGKGFLITPTGLPYDETEPEDLVRILFTDNGCYKAVGSRQPSSEWNLHAFLYQARPDINAVVHTHSPYATMLSCLDEANSSVPYMVAAVGGDTLPAHPMLRSAPWPWQKAVAIRWAKIAWGASFRITAAWQRAVT